MTVLELTRKHRQWHSGKGWSVKSNVFGTDGCIACWQYAEVLYDCAFVKQDSIKFQRVLLVRLEGRV